MGRNIWAKRAVCVALCDALLLTGCAVPQGGSGGSGGLSPGASQAGCILGHMAAGALTGVVLGGIVAGNMMNVGRNAAVGAIAGFAVAWMRCINQYATPTTTKVASMDSVAEPGYTAQQGTLVRVRSAYLDPSAISGGGKSTVKVAYLVMDGARDVSVNQTISFRFLMPDGTEQSSSPKVDRVVVEPGLHVVSVPIDIPREITDGKLVVTVDLEANGRSDRSSQELAITSETRRLDIARADVVRQRAEFDRIVASAGKGPTSPPASGTQLASNDRAGGKSMSPGQKTLVVNIPKANVRDQPSSKGKLVATAARGERLRIERETTGSEGRWLQVTVGGNTGWVGASAGSTE